MDASFWTYLRYLFELGLPLPSFMIPVFTGKPSGVCLCVCVCASLHVSTLPTLHTCQQLWKFAGSQKKPFGSPASLLECPLHVA